MLRLVLITIFSISFLIKSFLISSPRTTLTNLVEGLFPLTGTFTVFYFSLFLILGLLNLISLVAFSFPVTTTLAFNFRVAFILWFFRILLLVVKTNNVSLLVPRNSPWYLIMFLRLVEIVRIIVRPITLCFRLLANIRAGHILLSLIRKLPINSWLLGTLFGLLELIVALVQAFVFLILVRVYYEEAIRHSLDSFRNITLKKLKILNKNSYYNTKKNYNIIIY